MGDGVGGQCRSKGCEGRGRHLNTVQEKEVFPEEVVPELVLGGQPGSSQGRRTEAASASPRGCTRRAPQKPGAAAGPQNTEREGSGPQAPCVGTERTPRARLCARLCAGTLQRARPSQKPPSLSSFTDTRSRISPFNPQGKPARRV